MEKNNGIMVESSHIDAIKHNSAERFLQKRRMLEVEDILKRLKTYLGIKTNVELSEVLHVCPNTISTWKKRNSMDYSRLISFGKSHRIDLNRLFSNKIQKERPCENVIVVPWEFQHQYVTSFGKKEFLDSMPRHEFPLVSGEGKIRAFQVDNIISFSFFKGNFFAVGEFVHSVGNITEENIYILINKMNGISVGEIEQYIGNPDALYVVNDQNKIMGNKVRISVQDIVEIWKVNSIIFGEL